MNKILQIIRHAKSSWEYNVEDHERPLKKRGVNDAVLVSKHLKTNFLNPDAIYCSTSKRTKSTAMLFVDVLDLKNVKFELKKQLYDFSGEAILESILSCDDSNNVLMVFGHNFALTKLCNLLGDIAIDNVTTSGFVQIEFAQNTWKSIKNGKTTKIVFPKHLK
ncbi:SixA phosphatase family protein [Psychroserpens sp. NJDZ02]|uniref:SixA phosphatase family protein n=1 Tax=Psychroserpens sp. NJDZ02 TaxID=2570561 RepID=UPI0010A87F52|nr:histidine phosphatase family protein [Psychroserpens sp. NJDZ02]QCE43222.1 histidine phosphatase family protein [Psychroserpens sp. NJDZ02]